MKKQFLYVTTCMEMESKLEPSDSIQEVKKEAFFLISNTENLRF